MKPVKQLQTVIQYCVDPEKSGDWYGRFLGLPKTPYDGPLYLTEGGAGIFLAPGEPGTGRGGTAVCFLVDDVDEAHRERVAQGFEFNEEPYDVPTGRFVTINDPDGNIVGLLDGARLPGGG